MTNPTPDEAGLADRAKEELKQTAEQGKRWYKRYGGGQYELYWTYGVVVVIVLLIGVYFVGDKIRMAFLGGKEELAEARATAVVAWKEGLSGAAVPFDVNADGQLDVVGLFQGLDPKGDYVGAFDGKTGKQLWRLAPPKLGHQDRLTLVGDKLVLPLSNQPLQLIEPKTGKLLGTAKMPHRVRAVCPGPDGSAFVIRNYREYSKVSVPNLAVTGDDGAWCEKRALVGLGTEFEDVPALMGADGTQLARGAALQSGNVTLVTGKLKGKLVVVAMEPQGKEIWRRGLATPAQTVDVVRAEVGGVLYVVEAYAKPPALHAIDVATGKDKWSTSKLLTLRRALAVTASADAVYVATDGLLHVVDAKTGVLRFSLGEVRKH